MIAHGTWILIRFFILRFYWQFVAANSIPLQSGLVASLHLGFSIKSSSLIVLDYKWSHYGYFKKLSNTWYWTCTIRKLTLLVTGLQGLPTVSDILFHFLVGRSIIETKYHYCTSLVSKIFRVSFYFFSTFFISRFLLFLPMKTGGRSIFSKEKHSWCLITSLL